MANKKATLTKNGSNGHHTFTLTVEETATSQSANTSTISIKFQMSAASTGYDWEDFNNSAPNGKVTVNGTEYTWRLTDYDGHSTVTLVNKTQTVTHASDGTKTISLSFVCYKGSSESYLPGSVSTQSTTLALTTIARESSFTVSNGTLGTAQTITVTKKNSSYTHTITAKAGSYTQTICTTSSATSVSWTPALNLATANTTGTTVSVTVSLKTYSGSTQIGSAVTKTISCSIPSSVKSAISGTPVLSDAAGLYATFGGYIQGKSKVQAVITASNSSAQGATVKKAEMTVDGVTKSSSTSATSYTFTSDVLKTAGSRTVTSKITDTRGSTDAKDQTITVLAYNAPVITLSIGRCSWDADQQKYVDDDTGGFCKVKYRVTYTSLKVNNVEKNVTTLQISYVDKNGQGGNSTRQDLVNEEEGYVFQADAAKSYTVTATATDTVGSTSIVSSPLSTASVIMHFAADGTAMGIGKIEERSDALDVGWDLWVKDVDMTIQDNEYTQLAPTPASGTPKRLFSILKNIFKRNSPASGGTVLSMVNTGDMYTWNNKASTSVASASANGLMSSADKSKLNAVGDIGGAINGSTSIANKSVPGDSTITELGSFALSKGVWVVKIQVRFNANANGNRTIYLSTTSGGDALSVWNANKVPASPTNYTHVPLITFLRVDADSATYHITSQQNSGSAITAAIRWGAIRISD